MNPINFYSVIIGTEILNGRRVDAHFSFLNQQLLQRGWEHKASFVIEDDPKLMSNIFNLIKQDKNSVMFCFGGIGSTPDDYTRQIAAEVFTDGQMAFHKEAKQFIIEQFQEKAYPHRINMAYFPTNVKLLTNVVNNIPGFYIQDRFFFTPGFPSMSQNMVIEALDTLYPKAPTKKHRKAITITCAENDLIDTMLKIPKTLELSSLPKFINNEKKVVISLAGQNETEINQAIQLFMQHCDTKKLEYTLKDIDCI